MLGAISVSPLGYTTALRVEKRVAGYLSVMDSADNLTEFDRLVLTYGADVLRDRDGEEPRDRVSGGTDARRLDSNVAER